MRFKRYGACLPSVSVPPPPSLAPAQAQAVGYNTLTGSGVKIGGIAGSGVQWLPYNARGVVPLAGQYQQNIDGSLTCSPNGQKDGAGFGAALCTMNNFGSGLQGTAYGGGFYSEIIAKWPGIQGSTTATACTVVGNVLTVSGTVTGTPLTTTAYGNTMYATGAGISGTGNTISAQLSGTPFGIGTYAISGSLNITTPQSMTFLDAGKIPQPAFWANDSVFLGGSVSHWSAAFPTWQHRIEIDFLQWAKDTQDYYESTDIIDWYGNGNANSKVAAPSNGETHFGSALMSNYNTYGCLWVPATPTSLGYVTNYFNGVQVYPAVGTPRVITWQYWDPLNPPSPPPIQGTTAYSFMDQLAFGIILGTTPTNPLTVSSWTMWQANTSKNIVF